MCARKPLTVLIAGEKLHRAKASAMTFREARKAEQKSDFVRRYPACRCMCEDLHPWVKHVVTPLTCGYTWSSMWLHLVRTWLHLLELLSYCLPLSLYCLHVLCVNMSLSVRACLSAHMFCFVIFYCVLCIHHCALIIVHCAFTIVHLLLCIFFVSPLGKSCRQCITGLAGY